MKFKSIKHLKIKEIKENKKDIFAEIDNNFKMLSKTDKLILKKLAKMIRRKR